IILAVLCAWNEDRPILNIKGCSTISNTPLVTCPLASDWLERHNLKATVDHHHRLSHTPLVSSGELSFASLLPFVRFLGFLKVRPTLSCYHPPPHIDSTRRVRDERNPLFLPTL
ncbi:hypothetical protein N7501_006485, partial [Penicillium viridicatum]